MKPVRHLLLKAAATLALSTGILSPVAALANAPGAPEAVDTADHVTEIPLTVGKSSTIEVPPGYTDLMVGDAKIADVLPGNTHSVYVVGHTLGVTSLIIYGPGKRVVARYDLTIGPDVDGLKRRLSEVLPQEKSISVRTANQSIILSGAVSSPSAAQDALSLAESYAPSKVINMLGVEGTQQVMLSVRFVEMEHTLAKELDFNVQSKIGANGKSPFVIATGNQLTNTPNLLTNLFGGGSAELSRGAGALNLIFNALETKGLIKTLAEPNLVAMSGDTANFLAGGEFPIPVQQSSGSTGSAPTITVQFKQFGVALAFTPTILQDGLISIVVNPEVSSIDPSSSVTVGTIQVPGLKVRRAHTTVELRDGESFTIGGLLQDNYTSQISGMPFVGDVPVLGALFRSNGYKRDETELVIVVTARLVTPHKGPSASPADHFTPPSDLELFLLGSQQSLAASNLDRALVSSAETKGGLDGPHGHVLY